MRRLIDNPIIINNLFFVRKTVPYDKPIGHIHDGSIAVDDEVALGYRLFVHTAKAPLVVLFHGNGEIAADYDMIAPYYHVSGASLMVVDFRGYGWSTGTPLPSKMLPDALEVWQALPQVLPKHGINADVPRFVKGRSLGSACAIYVAYKISHEVAGLMIESGYADAPSLFRRLGIPIPPVMMNAPDLPVNNLGKIEQANVPLLVIHGANDTLIPVQHGKDLYEHAPTSQKTLLVVEGAGHNDLLSRDPARYFDAIKQFIARHTSNT
jgi:alpha-beta hydrolase superfamily lysophospholipase